MRDARPPAWSPIHAIEPEFILAVLTIRRDDDREQTFRIVGEDEANPSKGSVSHVSPLARALLGKSVGEEVKAGNRDALIRYIR
ncbi:MAG: GreA/GreB family elongation factor [Xanthobacteraceae bacterium]